MDVVKSELDYVPVDFFTSCFLSLELSKAATINVLNSSGWSGLMYACHRGNLKTVNYLMKNGASTNLRGSEGLPTPLMIAAGGGNLELLKCVFDVKDLELIDHRGWTALFHAIFYGRELCVDFLIKNGANINKRDNLGRNPALLAVKSGMESLVELFVKADADLRVKSYEEESALNLGAASASPQIRKMTSALSPKNLINPLRQQLRATHIYSPNKIKIHGTNKENMTGKHVATLKTNVIKSGILSPLNKGPISPYGTNEKAKHTLQVDPLKPEHDSKVQSFLQKLNLEKYWPIFRDEEVDFETLMTFNDQNLLELGIKLYGPRKKILAAIEEVKSTMGPNFLAGFTRCTF